MPIDVVMGLETVAFRCEGAGHGIEADLTWQAAAPAADGPRRIRPDGRIEQLGFAPPGSMALGVGLGYGPEDDGGSHGRWMGEPWIPRVDGAAHPP